MYRAVQQSVGRDVAVKVENRRLESERDQRRFLREARAAGRMSGHPNVIDLFDAGVTANGHPYLIMELCEGSYAERMKHNPLSAVEARDVGVKIADALADAHALGVLHRDVKPANLLISRFGEPQLADFGLAILSEARDHSITLDVLTPAYAPPEMFRYTEPSPASDVYGLSATLYALMWGRPPRWHDEINPSLLALYEMFHQPIPAIPGVPPPLMDLLRAGMATDERDRPSALEMRDTLLDLDLDVGGPSTHHPRRPAFGPPSWGPSESVSPATTPHSAGFTGWPEPPPAGSEDETAQEFPGDNAQTVANPTEPVIDPLRFPPSPSSPPPPSSESSSSPSEPGEAGRDTPSGGIRRWLWFGLTAGSLIVVSLVGTVAWAVVANRSTVRTLPRAVPSPSPGRSSSPSPSPCALAVTSPGVQCAATPECFGQMGKDHRAAAVACDQPHAWEVFAVGILPAGLPAVDYDSLRKTRTVRGACTATTLALVDFNAYAWKVDVVGPTLTAYRTGDRTFRCVAGPASGMVTGSTFTRR